MQRLDGMIKQSEMVNKTKEQDFRMALESRDEARREIKTLENRVENLGKVHQKKVRSLLLHSGVVMLTLAGVFLRLS